MNIKKARLALEKVAEREGLSIEQVIEEIEDLISEAIDRSYSQKNMSAIAAWERVPCKGVRPTAIELVAYLTERVREAM